ncbi:MAG: hypothetical protein COB93_06480 [Sneathiella sp.]|nr:MAG: hypothetical protein COB93_06480 [Sneathiella sp.]
MTKSLPPRKSARFNLMINGKLFLALSFLAGMSIVAGIIAWISFDHVSSSTEEITMHSLPEIDVALQLAEMSAQITSAAPDLMADTNLLEHRKTVEDLVVKAANLSGLIDVAESVIEENKNWMKLKGIEKELARSLDSLKKDVESKLIKSAERETRMRNLNRAHHSFLLITEPLIDDAVFDFVMEGEKISSTSKRSLSALVTNATENIKEFLDIRAEIGQAEDILSEAFFTDSQARLDVLRGEFAGVNKNTNAMFAPFDGDKVEPPFVVLGKAILEFGSRTDNVFMARKKALGANGQLRQELDARLLQEFNFLKSAHANFQKIFAVALAGSLKNLDEAARKETASSTEALSDLIDIGTNKLYSLLSLRAEGNLIVGILSEAANVGDIASLQPFRERFQASSGRVKEMLDELAGQTGDGDLHNATFRLLGFGAGANNLFDIRQTELANQKRANAALGASRAIALRLNREVAAQVVAARQRSALAAVHSGEVVETGKYLLIIIASASILTALFVMFAFVRPLIIRPLENITDAMTRLAAGDIDVRIPSRQRNDEIGHMADALAVFRDTAVEIQASNHKEIEEGQKRLASAIESISEGFSFYDANDKLAVCNSVYRRLFFPDQTAQSQYGRTFEEIMRQALERGAIEDATGREEDWVLESLDNHFKDSSSYVQRRTSGRWILVNERKTEDNSTVAVYSDITKIKRQEAAIAEQSSSLERLSNQLAKYLSPQVYASIFEGKNQGDINSRRKKLTIFFSDIVGFTEITERFESEDLTRILNQYLTEMSNIALAHGATIDKYVGDAIVIFFGDPESLGVKEDATACVKMALAMKKRLQELNEEWFEVGIKKPLQCRMGINTGYCTVGNFGSSERMDYTVIGKGVNIASRLESSAKSGEIRISHETYANVKDEILCGNEFEVTVKGIKFPIATYEVLSERGDVSNNLEVIHEEFQNVKLDINLKDMSSTGRQKTRALLQKVLVQIGEDGED